MKRGLNILVLVALLAVSVFSVASAAGPTGTYVSGISCANLEDVAGTLSITFYNTAGSVVATLDDSIGAKGSKLYFTPTIASTPALPSGFLGSAVASSSVKLACAVNTQTNGGTLRVGTSNGVASDETSTKLYAPQIMNNLSGWSSYVAVQNTTGAVASVTAKYFNSTGVQVFTVSKNIPANSTFVFYQDGDADGNSTADLPAGFIGSATFESTATLAGTVAMYNAGSSASTAQFLSYNTFSSGAMKVYLPRVVKNLSGVAYTSGITCQNVGAATTNISIAFSIFDQTTSSYVTANLSKTGIATGQAWAIYMGSTLGISVDSVVKGYGSAVVTSTASEIACSVNEDNRVNFAGLGSTYSGVPDGKQTVSMSFPQITALGANSYRGGFQIANTTATSATCTYTFSNGEVVSNQALAGNGSISVFAENVLVNKTTFNGSVIVTCTQPIVGIYNLASPTQSGDTFATNNGINLAP